MERDNETYRILTISFVSVSSYFFVETINIRSNRSTGIPCGDLYLVPRIRVMPRFEAITTSGASSPSRARLRNEKHSMSSMCTSSMKRTWCTDQQRRA
jgi:hypothetical protein